ncbi:hypothetical protein FB192DRAFT_1403992 [Mucor lusitanicus]|uniref:Uncharacterized protein n=2 Tax=Mucor circinelloides f. lusitanicus TaxID=29924 RepID=A0A168HLR7_MUCCL|nr:hypothetical protein FB192DRAFT_1403992 [Mucor lusitanicus]OAC98938.1 hypothetical protein MUCCIDRAFT_115184 [Mucor lusitanicus CBS 277.49]
MSTEISFMNVDFPAYNINRCPVFYSCFLNNHTFTITTQHTMKNNTTSIIERPKEETSIMEHPMTEDDLTHPGLYRFKKNSPTCYTYHGRKSNEQAPLSSAQPSNPGDWDLYPGLRRDIVNEGSRS